MFDAIKSSASKFLVSFERGLNLHAVPTDSWLRMLCSDETDIQWVMDFIVNRVPVT